MLATRNKVETDKTTITTTLVEIRAEVVEEVTTTTMIATSDPNKQNGSKRILPLNRS